MRASHTPIAIARRSGLGAVTALLALLPCVAELAAQSAPPGPPEPVPTAAQPAGERRWWLLWSVPSREDRVLWAMKTLHIHHWDWGFSTDALYGAVYRGLYAASFLTTHGPRGYTIGIERTWIEGGDGTVAGMLGFRTGLVYGYDRRLGWLAEAVPILPFAQPVIYGRAGPFTADVTYTWVVISFTFGIRL